MADTAISVKQLSKVYRVPQKDPGLAASVRGLFKPRFQNVEAVQQVTFSIQAGEMVGLIGPNGAGKTTTLKMLTGLLYPTSGHVDVLGYEPWKRSPAFLKRISMVLGNKSQVAWDIPPLDSFRMLAEIYNLPKAAYQKSLDELVTLLDIGDLLKRPVRNMSLGERMKCELVAGLLHRPDVLFLDEPTLGLDVSMQIRLRQFLADYNRNNHITVILTSHYMADVQALCPRVILIHHGILLYDGALAGLAADLAPFKLLRITLDISQPQPALDLPNGCELLDQQPDSLTLRVQRAKTSSATAALLNRLPVVDLSVENPPIETVIDRIYREAEL